MAAKQRPEDLHTDERHDEDLAQATNRPAGSATPNSQSSTVSHELFSTKLSSTAAELALQELLSTIEEAAEVRQRTNARQRLLQSHIVALREDAEMMASFEIADGAMRAQVTQAVFRARKLCRQLERDIIERETEAEGVVRNEQQQVQLIQLDTARSTGMKLAPLKPLTFNGDTAQFSVYRDFFEENVLHNDQLTDTAKWLRLTESLTGSPAELLSELPRTSHTLTIAWKLLVDTFGADDRPIAALYAKLQQLPQATMSTASLKMTHSKLEGVLLTLEHLGHDVGENGYIRWLYMNKFPMDVAYQVQKKKNTPLAELRSSVGDLIRAREGADQQAGQLIFQGPSTSSRGPIQRAAPAGAGAAKRAATAGVRVCVFCSGDHWNDACATYTTIEARKQKLAGRCFRCLRKAHENECINPRRCFHCDSMEHNRALCPARVPGKAEGKSAVVQAAVVTESETASAKGYFLAFVAQASSSYARQPLEIRAVVDTGGGSTLIQRGVADQLGIPVRKTGTTAYTGLGGSQLVKSQPLTAPLRLRTHDGSEIDIQAEAVDWIIPEVPTADVEEFKRRHPHLGEVYIPPTGGGRPIDLLIGSDVMVELLLPQPIQRVDDDTLLMPTVFGALIVGRTREKKEEPHQCLLFHAQENPMYQLCSLDVVGLAGLHNSEIEEEEQAIKKFYSTVKFIQNRYSISWPWKTNPPNLDVNFGLAWGRLRTLHRKLRSSPQLLLEYHDTILKQLEAGVVETVDRKGHAERVVHYVPHHPVLQPGKDVRPVYDGSSKAGKAKKSLNDNILKGKNWLNDLVKTLLRFRRYKNVVISDIAKAFHQIAINEEDRDAVRFLWLKEPLQPPTEENLQVYRFTRVAFGIVASPFILSATIQYHASKRQSTAALEIILQDMYADNLVSSLPETIEPARLYDYAKDFFQSMSMNLTKWATNNEQLQRAIPTADQAQASVQAVLGLKWDTREDTLQLKQPKAQFIKPPTRRLVAKEMASYFDPMGWAVPTLLLAKNFFRRVWAETDNWDAALNPAQAQEWMLISEKLKQISSIKLPRKFEAFAEDQKIEIHTFVDASATAYAVVVYLRTQSEGAARLSFVAAKSRLTPTKITTIPKLELIAILLGCQFTQFVQTTLKIPQAATYIWSDSRCALSWIKQEKILPTVIEKHILEAKTYKISNFRYVPSERNFADVATRGAEVSTLLQMNWWAGPKWLEREAEWPAAAQSVIESESISLVFQTKLMEKARTLKETEIPGICNMKIWEFSSLSRLLLRTTHTLKALTRLLKKNFLKLQTELDTTAALKMWLRWDQRRIYTLQGDVEEGRETLLRNITVFRDEDGVVRCQTRLQNSFLELEATTPVLLVKDSTLTKLIVLHTHKTHMHAGTNHTLAALRQKYWLPQGRRQTYKIIINNCFACRRQNAQIYPAPPPAPLPEFRVLRVQKPFQATGVDVFGPFRVRRTTSTQTYKEKRWVLIFTCATIRAIHLETLSEMTTTEISYAFRRFFARRGVPRKIISDNAPQFHSLDGHFRNLWRAVMKSPSISNYFAEQQIVWEFTPELAPWMGGIYERLIQTIKKSFEKTYGDKTLTDKQFTLAMIEIEAILNSRPIAYVDRDPECPIVTPNDFLMAKFTSLPIQQTPEEADGNFAKLWKSSQAYLDQFWTAWADQYIMLLRERNDQLRHQRLHAKCAPEKGDIVIMQDLTKRRSGWQLAVVERRIQSSDGEVRSVQVRIPNGARLIRPVITLAPLGMKMHLPAVRDDQLSKRKDTITIWPIEDIPTETTSELNAIPNVQQRASLSRADSPIASDGRDAAASNDFT